MPHSPAAGQGSSPAQAPLPPGIPRITAFDDGEYRARLSQVRDRMSGRKIDALLVVDAGNVFYLSGVESQGAGHVQCLVVPREDDAVLVTWEFERGAALLTGWVDNIVTYGWFDDPLARLAGTIESLSLSRSTLAIDMRARELSAARFGALGELVPNARFVDSWGIVEGCRVTKSPAELEHIRAAAAITDTAVEAAYSMIATGVRDTDVAAAITGALYSGGSETVCWGPIVASGYGAGLMHTSFHGRTLARGDTVFLELSGQVHRYLAPVMRTVVLGDPTAEMLDFRDAGMAALQAVLETARPGVTAAEVARAGARALAPVADRAFFHGLFGYSVGLGFPPSWYETLGFELKVENERPLEAGMVFHIPISLRRYAEFGVCQSQTIVVTPAGAEPLARTAAEMVVAR